MPDTLRRNFRGREARGDLQEGKMSRRAATAALMALVSLAVCSTASADSSSPINGYRVKASAKNLERLALAGFDVTEGRNARRRTVEVFGSAAQLAKLRRDTGTKSHLGRDVIALKVTRNAKTTPDGSRPAVLYSALQHAREWLAGETCKRTLKYFTSNYGKDPQVTRLVDENELWFV